MSKARLIVTLSQCRLHAVAGVRALASVRINPGLSDYRTNAIGVLFFMLLDYRNIEYRKYRIKVSDYRTRKKLSVAHL